MIQQCRGLCVCVEGGVLGAGQSEIWSRAAQGSCRFEREQRPACVESVEEEEEEAVST